MKLVRLTFENYKIFKNRESIEFRPLTIIIGRNNSGKSVITRFPLILARSLSEVAQSPLDLKIDGLDFSQSFVDVIHNRSPHGAVHLSADFLTDTDEPISMAVTIQYFSEYRLQHVQSFACEKKGKTFTLNWRGTDPVKEPNKYSFDEESIDVPCFLQRDFAI